MQIDSVLLVCVLWIMIIYLGIPQLKEELRILKQMNAEHRKKREKVRQINELWRTALACDPICEAETKGIAIAKIVVLRHQLEEENPDE